MIIDILDDSCLYGFTLDEIHFKSDISYFHFCLSCLLLQAWFACFCNLAAWHLLLWFESSDEDENVEWQYPHIYRCCGLWTIFDGWLWFILHWKISWNVNIFPWYLFNSNWSYIQWLMLFCYYLFLCLYFDFLQQNWV